MKISEAIRRAQSNANNYGEAFNVWVADRRVIVQPLYHKEPTEGKLIFTAAPETDQYIHHE